MAMAKAAPEATAVRFQPRTRVPCTVASPNSPVAVASGAPSARDSSRDDGTRRAPVRALTRSWSPVRRKKCWMTGPPAVATTLTTPAPRMVP